MSFEEINELLTDKGFTPIEISLIVGFTPYLPERYIGPDSCGLPVQSVISIYKHLTYKGASVLVGYKSTEELEADRLQFEALIGDNTCKRALGWYKGSSEFSIELYYE